MYPQQPQFQQQQPFHPCAQCGGYPGPQPFYSPQGHSLCHRCYHAGAQQAAQGRAQQASGSGYVYLGNDSAMSAGMAQDLETKLLRKCAKCQAHAVSVVHVTFHYVNGITRGRTYENACKACGVRFKTESLLRTIVEGGMGFVCVLVGLLFGISLLDGHIGWVTLGTLLVPFGFYMVGLTTARIIARFRNPVVPRLAG